MENPVYMVRSEKPLHAMPNNIFKGGCLMKPYKLCLGFAAALCIGTSAFAVSASALSTTTSSPVQSTTWMTTITTDPYDYGCCPGCSSYFESLSGISTTYDTNNCTPDYPPFETAPSTGVTTTCVSDSDIPVWDEDGRYRGTNAIFDAYLYLEKKPKMTYAVGEKLDLTDMKLVVVEQRRFNTWHHDVTGMVDVWTDYDPYTPGTYTVELSTTYNFTECDLSVSCISFTVDVDESLPMVTTAPDDFIMTTTTIPTTPTTTATTSMTTIPYIVPVVTLDPSQYPEYQEGTVETTCVSEATIPVWDENGYYRGTNALMDVRLEFRTEPDLWFIGGEPLDFNEHPLDIVLVEERRFNIIHHDVSNKISKIETGYPYYTTGMNEYAVYVYVDYTIPEWNKEIAPLQFSIHAPQITSDYFGTTTTTEETTTTTTTTTTHISGGDDCPYCSSLIESMHNATATTTTTTTAPLTIPEDAGDINADNSTDISDVILLCRIAAEDTSLDLNQFLPQRAIDTSALKERADVNGDGKVNALDATLIIKRIAKLI